MTTQGIPWRRTVGVKTSAPRPLLAVVKAPQTTPLRGVKRQRSLRLAYHKLNIRDK